MKELSEFDAVTRRVITAIYQLPRRAATVAVNFSKERFRAGNWVDHTTEPWKPRKETTWKKPERKGRAILVKSGRLRRSIRIESVTAERAVLATDVPYARAHNEGFKGSVEQEVKQHERRKPRSRTERVTVKSHKRTIKQNIPKRQFIGTSAVLERQLQRMINAELMRTIKNR